MTSSKSLISIIIPAYNRGGIISETLESVLSQSYPFWECIVVDDHSTDDTAAIVKSYANRDQRISYVLRPKEKAKGAAACRNYGVEKAKGEYLQFLDSDDLLGKSKLAEQVRVLTKHGKSCLATCKWGYFSQSSKIIDRFKYKYHIYRDFEKTVKLLNFMGLFNEFFPSHVYLFSRRLFTDAGSWNEELTNNDDAEFFTRVILKASKIRFVPGARVYYRSASSQKLSELNSEEKVESAIRSWKVISEHFRGEHPSNPGYYVKNSINNLHNMILLKAPELEPRYREFLREKQEYNSLYYKIMKRITS